MHAITEPGREIPVVIEADIVVCGGGPGGLPAAVAAARHGANVLLIERYGFLGGLATAGLIAPLLGHAASRSNRPIVEGLLRETVERMHALGGAPSWQEACQEWGIRFNAEAFKRVADEMVQEAGVNLLLHTLVTDAIVEDDRITATNTMHRDHFSPNMTRWAGDPTDVRDLTQAELDIRRDVWDLLAFLKEEVPGFENCYLRLTSPQVGVRESRQVIGDYVLTGEDVQQGRKFKDAVARGSWYIDVHCPLGETYLVHLCVIECPKQENCPFWAAEHNKSMISRDDLYPPDDDWYDIPYRCLMPKGINNLLVSGRCISATHEAMAGARVMGTCMAIGQAAGTAASLSVCHEVWPRDVDADELRRVLQADGALV
jgi:hypothetical protein